MTYQEAGQEPYAQNGPVAESFSQLVCPSAAGANPTHGLESLTKPNRAVIPDLIRDLHMSLEAAWGDPESKPVLSEVEVLRMTIRLLKVHLRSLCTH